MPRARARHGCPPLATGVSPKYETECQIEHHAPGGGAPARHLVGDNLLRVVLPKGIAGNTTDCEIMIDQSRAIDSTRLKRHLGVLPRRILAEVKAKLRTLGDL